MDLFDPPDLVSSCPKRSTTTVAPQALQLLNNKFVIGQSTLFAERRFGEVFHNENERSTMADIHRLSEQVIDYAERAANVADAAKGKGPTPEALLSFYLDQVKPADYDRAAYDDLLAYLGAGVTWTGSDAQLLIKAPGLLHLIVGSSEYQLV